MANNYIQFSEMIDNLTKEEAAWFQKELEPPELLDGLELEDWKNKHKLVHDGDDLLNWPEFSWQIPENKQSIWFYGEESGNIENLAWIVKRFLKKFRPNDSFSLAWAETCSKMRLSEFSGGAVFVTANSIKWNSSYSFLYKCEERHRKSLERRT